MTRSVQAAHLPRVQGMKAYYNNARYSDLSITCAGMEFQCHKIIVCPQSKFFDAACTHGSQDSINSQINLVDNDPQHINLMLEFLYDHKYEVVLKPNWFRTRDIVLVHVSLYALGVKYKIPALCHYSAHQIYEHMLSGHLSHYGAQACIPLVYSSTPGTNRALRDLFVSFIVNCTYGMYKSPHTFNVGMEHVHAIKEFREDFVRELLRWCWSEDPEQEGFNFPTYTL